MSRGLGLVQRQVLAAIPDLGGSGDVQWLALYIYGNAPIGGSRYESVRRAVQSLVRRGLVRQCAGRRDRIRIDWDDGSRSWHDQFELLSVGNSSIDTSPTLKPVQVRS